MRIGLFIPYNSNSTEGGGFTYVEQLVKKLLAENKLNFEFIPFYIVDKKEYAFNNFFYNYLKSNSSDILVFEKKNRKSSYLLRILKRISLLLKLNSLYRILFNIIEDENIIIENLTKVEVGDFLINNNIDLVYYPLPMEVLHKNIPYYCTVWDLIHLKAPYFPEIIENSQFEIREKLYRSTLFEATAIVVESQQGANELRKYYNIDLEKTIHIPLLPGDCINEKIDIDEINSFLNINKLKSQEYFFYPAQFWAHKNHKYLLEAFKLLIKNYPNFKLVFTGSDKGNLKFIHTVVKELGLEDNILNLGFVSLKELNILYSQTSALVMCTMFDPTSIPIIEAMANNCPVICSDTEGHREQLGGFGLFFDPKSSIDIFDAMCLVLDNKELVSFKVEKAHEFYLKVIDNKFELFYKSLNNFSEYLKTWK